MGLRVAACARGSAGASLAHVGRQRDAGGLEQRPGEAGGGRAQGHLPPVLADRDLLETIEAAQHIAPLGPEARSPAARILPPKSQASKINDLRAACPKPPKTASHCSSRV